MDNPMIRQIVTTLLRYLLGGFFAMLVAKGALTADQTEYIIAGLVGFLLTVGMALYARYKDRLKIVTALSMPSGATEQQVDSVIKQGHAPSATTPKTITPTRTP